MRPRILFLSANLPFPPHSGPTNRTLHVLRELGRAFDVTLIAFARRQHHPSAFLRQEAAQALAREVDTVLPPEPIGAEWSRGARIWNHARSLVLGRPYTEYEYASPRVAAGVRSAVASAPPALVHLDSLDLFRWARTLPPVPVTCTHHSIESELLRRRAERAGPATAWYLRRQASLIADVERALCPTFALNLMMSDREADELRALAPTARTLVVPNGVDAARLRPTDARRDPSRLVFVGPAYVFANRDAIEHFLSAMWPAIRAGVPDATVRLVGSCPPGLRERFERQHGVTCTGYVEDLQAELGQAACAVVPIRLGGGTRLKIVDAWATGTPVVSTTIGCEGLAAVHGRNILIADRPEAFADAVISVLGSDELRQRLGDAARRTIEERYDWSRIGETLRTAYRGLLDAPLPGRRAGPRSATADVEPSA